MTVVLALAPAMAASVWFLRLACTARQVVAVVACWHFEALGLTCSSARSKEHHRRLSSGHRTPVLLGHPSSIPIWMTVVVRRGHSHCKIPYGYFAG
jgi:Na+-translocating ferredoxin:NAD+ oxidoreductase RnfD subunit